ncbi:MAG: putative hydrolase or acyltransferase of alpha/beta superfamily [Actinomycetia bacterium]|nr:putative hydrolase or acyltransferase of alpha/beta superfamily [Actinomycetes bacterium]
MPSPSTRIISTPAVRLAVHDWGGDGPPVLLAHPTGFHGMVWAPVAERLRAAGRHPWSFDFRGHGASDRAPDGYAWGGFADDVLAVTRACGLAGDPELLAWGHSKGAAALLLAESREPGTYPRVYAFEPIVFPGDAAPSPDNPLSRGARKRRAVWDSRAEARASYASRPPLDVLTPEALDAYVGHGFRDRPDGKVELACIPDDEAEIYSMAGVADVFRRLAGIQARVVVACGALTDAIAPALAELLAAELPHGETEVFADLGHFGPLEAPDPVTAAALRFRA